MKAGSRFFSNIPSHYPLLFKSLGQIFVSAIKSNDDHLAFECARYLDYCYIKLMKHDHGIEELDYITITLQYLAEGLSQLAQMHKENTDFYRIYLRDATLLVYNLIARRESVERYMAKEQDQLDKKYLQESGKEELPVERIEYRKGLKEQEEKMKEVFIEIEQKIESFFIVLGQIIKKTPNIQIF